MSLWRSSERFLRHGDVVKSVVGGVSFSGFFLRVGTLVCSSIGLFPLPGVGETTAIGGVDSEVHSDFNTAVRHKSNRLTHFPSIWLAATASLYALFDLGKAEDIQKWMGIFFWGVWAVCAAMATRLAFGTYRIPFVVFLL